MTNSEGVRVSDIVRIGDATLYHADCWDVLPTCRSSICC